MLIYKDTTYVLERIDKASKASLGHLYDAVIYVLQRSLHYLVEDYPRDEHSSRTDDYDQSNYNYQSDGMPLDAKNSMTINCYRHT